MKRLVFLLLSLSVLFSCDKFSALLAGGTGEGGDGSEKGRIEFPDGSGVTLDQNGRGSLRLQATHAWTSVIDWQGSGEGWLTMDPTSGDKGGDYTIQFAANSRPEPNQRRGAEVVFRIADHKFRANVFQQNDAVIFISSVSLNPSGPLTIKVGQKVDVTASYQPSNATVVDLRWDKPDGTAQFDIATNNPLMASIHGKVPGKATITVVAKTATGYDGPSAKLEVTVVE